MFCKSCLNQNIELFKELRQLRLLCKRPGIKLLVHKVTSTRKLNLKKNNISFKLTKKKLGMKFDLIFVKDAHFGASQHLKYRIKHQT